MRDHDLALAIGRALAAVLAVRVYAHDLVLMDDGNGDFTPEKPSEVELPCVCVSSKSEALAGSTQISRATLLVSIESQADDDDSETHAARVSAVCDAMRDQAALVAAAAIDGRVQLLGKPCAIDTDPDTEQRAFQTVLTFRAGYADA